MGDNDFFALDMDFDTAFSRFTAEFALNYKGLEENDKDSRHRRKSSISTDSSSSPRRSVAESNHDGSSTAGDSIPNGAVASAFASSLFNEKESWALTDFLDKVSVDPNFLFDPKLADGLIDVEFEGEDDIEGGASSSSATGASALGGSGDKQSRNKTVGPHPPLAFASDPNFPPFRKQKPELFSNSASHQGQAFSHHHHQHQHQQQTSDVYTNGQYSELVAQAQAQVQQQVQARARAQAQAQARKTSQSHGYQYPNQKQHSQDVDYAKLMQLQAQQIPVQDTSATLAQHQYQAPLSLPHQQNYGGFSPESSSSTTTPESAAASGLGPAIHPTGSISKSSSKPKAKRTGRRESLTEDQKRQNHISSEKRRRDLIKKQFDKMCSMVPTISDNTLSNRRSKSDILMAVYEYLVYLIEQNQYIRQELAKNGVDSSQLPPSATEMPPQPNLY